MDEKLIAYILSFLGGGFGGGIIVAWINWKREQSIESRRNIIDYTASQLKNLYGPLYFFTTTNDEIVKLCNKLDDAYSNVFASQNWSEEEATQDKLQSDIGKTLDARNRYVSIIKENNFHIHKILLENYCYMDVGDVECFKQFIVDYSRLGNETDTNGKLKIPYKIYVEIGDISYARPEFIDTVVNKFLLKKKLLSNLHRC